MAKEDLPPRPDSPPRNRRQLEALPDLWIAEWLAGDTIKPGERKKLEALKESRKHRKPDVVLGVVVAPEGMTPEQFKTFQRVLPRMGATEVHHTLLPGKVYRIVKELGVPMVRYDQYGQNERDVIKSASVLLAAPKEPAIRTYATRGVWSMIGLAKHRSVPVRIVLPDGKEAT